MPLIPNELHHFLTTYLAVEHDPSAAVRTFVQSESPDQVKALLTAIRTVFENDPPEASLKQEIELAGNLKLRPGTTIHNFLLDLFSLISREANLRQTVKPYDAFISYSSKDRDLAARITAELRRHGYAVWLDRDEILVGHNILDEVYRGILQSQFLIVLLTKEAVKSKWVREELSAGKIQEIENARVTVLPVKCEPDVEIPAVLQGKRGADFTQSETEGLQALMRAIDLHRSGVIGADTETNQQAATYLGLRQWYHALHTEPIDLGYDPAKGGYKDVVIGTPDGDDVHYDKQQLIALLEKTRVRIRGWGGAPFPYDVYSKARLDNVPDGIRVIDTHTWVFSVWSFTYWRFTEQLRFFQRAGLLEDGDLGENGQIIMKGCLNLIWTIKDVCTALMFSLNLLNEVPALRRMVVIHRLGGMNGRRLVVRGFNRAPLMGDYVAQADTIEQVSIIRRGDDLETEAIKLLKEIFWLFNWRDFLPDAVREDIKAFIEGRFPSNW